MANNSGTLVTAPIRPQGELDVFPVALANELQGGFQTRGTITARDNIPEERREIGMLCFVTTEDKYYQLVGGITNADWVQVTLGGGGATSAANVSYANTEYPSFSDVKDVLDSLLYVDISASINNTVGVVEKGSTVSTVTLNWTVNKTPTVLSLNQGIGVITSSLLTYDYTTPFTVDKTFTLSFEDGTTSGTASSTVYFRQKRYYGLSALTSLTSEQTLLLGSSAFATSRGFNWTVDGGGNYLYICFPVAWGSPLFKANGFLSTMFDVTSMEVTNSSGYASSYYICKSKTVQYGEGILIEVY